MTGEDYVWRAERIEPLPDAAPSHARVRLDGFFAASYLDAYFAASQHLLSRSNELAIPILYLQRHTLELAVKDVLKGVLSARQEARLLRDIFGPKIEDDDADEKDWSNDMKLAHGCHRFDLLFGSLAKNLKLRGLPELPEDFFIARAFLEGLEDGEPTRFRYDTVGRNRKRPTFEFSDPARPKIARLAETSTTLTRIVTEHCRLSVPQGEPSSFLDHVVEDMMCSEYDVTRKLEELDEATRRGHVVWNATKQPALDIDGHPDFDDPDLRRSVVREYLFAEHLGRRFVVLVLRDVVKVSGQAERENEYWLACQRPGGLGRTVHPYSYQSNIIRSALRSWQRLPNDLPLPPG